jgi:protein phosphatase
LTTDDTWLSAVIAAGTLDPASLARHPMRNVLTQAVGSHNDINIHTKDLPLEAGDVLLLSTDGLHAVIGENAICAALEGIRTPESLVKHLVESSRIAGGPDNITCVAVEVDKS